MDELFYALTELTEAQKEYDRAESKYDGYSWGYHGQVYEDAVNLAKNRFEKAFRLQVLSIVAEQGRVEDINALANAMKS